MKLFTKIFVLFTFLLFLLVNAPVETSAQSKVFNMPSTDIVSKGKIEASLVAKFKTNDEEEKHKFSSFIPRVVYGVGKNVEIGLDVTGNTQPGTDTTTLVPTVKWRFYENEKEKISLTVGNSLQIPIRHKKYNLGNYAYFAGSKTLSSGTKLTLGSYYFTKNVAAKNASRGGGQFGVEQKITHNFGVAAEWYTGRHSYGYLTSGLKWKLNKKLNWKFAYSIANHGAAKGNHYFYTSMNVKFN